MKHLIDTYIDSKKLAWAGSTLRSERYRLYAVAPALDGDPATLWSNIEHNKPYSRLTTWTRVTEFYNWLIKKGLHSGENKYQTWREENAKCFKNVYTPVKPSISYQEAKNRVASIVAADVRQHAEQILGSGERFTESTQVLEGGQVTGKGSRKRLVFRGASQHGSTAIDYTRFRRILKQFTGLKPHDLRKLFLSRLVELGANEFELMEIAGWGSIQTATSYIKVNSTRIKKLIEQV